MHRPSGRAAHRLHAPGPQQPPARVLHWRARARGQHIHGWGALPHAAAVASQRWQSLSGPPCLCLLTIHVMCSHTQRAGYGGLGRHGGRPQQDQQLQDLRQAGQEAIPTDDAVKGSCAAASACIQQTVILACCVHNICAIIGLRQQDVKLPDCVLLLVQHLWNDSYLTFSCTIYALLIIGRQQ